jgi:uncharacterized protein YdiU (UPF0061 family)
MKIPFENTYVALPEALYHRQTAESVSNPKLVAWNADLASELGITDGTDTEKAEIFGGNRVPDGAEPLAQLYAGHQFGHYNPQLGDGRALLLGEVIDKHGERRDIQLKGSGRTPYSRAGDGRAWVGPVLREFIVSEAMNALGVPTTRALAAVTTGDQVYREYAYPGAVLTRIASSHLRVGTFQVLAYRQEHELLAALYNHAMERHYPTASSPVEFLSAVAKRQVQLVAHWLGLGFVHGVMNTDNCTISGETIDYGPCAFQDRFDMTKVFSSIDRHGRYSYSAQADIIVWNMAQLANALIPLMPDPETAAPEFQHVITKMQDDMRTAWKTRFCAKLGIGEPADGDETLVVDLLQIMHTHELDFTLTFHALTQGKVLEYAAQADGLSDWVTRWEQRTRGIDPIPLMQKSNPWIIPRNHQVERAIEAAVDNDFTAMHRMLDAVTRPFELEESNREFSVAPKLTEEVTVTYCGT